MKRAGTLAATALVAIMGCAALAQADVGGPDDTLAQANGPLVAGNVVAGALISPSDLDDFAFDVPTAGTELAFTVTNTLQSCISPAWLDDDCVLYATLVDASGAQVGGATSAAGTGPLGFAGAGYNTDVIDWTFAQPGRYYLIVEGNGIDESLETPSYTVRMDGELGGGGSGGTSGQPGSGPGGQSGTGASGSRGGSRSLAAMLSRIALIDRSSRVRRGSIGIRLRCLRMADTDSSCRGALAGAAVTVGHRRLTGARAFSIPAGAARTVALSLTAAARRTLATHHRLRAELEVSAGSRMRMLAPAFLLRG